MRLRLALAAALIAVTGQDVYGLDFSTVTCRAFLASGRDNMGVTIMWLHGLHAGKTGGIAFESYGPYARRLGQYCKDHPLANLIDVSKKILTDEDHGI